MMSAIQKSEEVPQELYEALHRQDPITVKSGILIALYEAKKNHQLIGIYSKQLVDQPCLTTVTDIVSTSQGILVALIGYDFNGYFYEHDKILLQDIASVILFKTKFENPFLRILVPRKTPMEIFRAH